MEKAKEYNAVFMEVSAKTGQNVKELFQSLTKHLTQDDYGGGNEGNAQDKHEEIQLNLKNIEETEKQMKKKNKCCSK